MKKVLSFVLVLSMILGSFGMAFAAAPSDVVGKDCEDAVNVLIELGVVEGYKDGSFKPENIVTRAEMATLIIKALGLNDYAVGKSSFTDMAGHWADPYVAYAASLGFIAGYSDGTFRPNETVSYDQAITMLVQALGYKGEYLTGGYPGAFVAQAKTLGMLDGVVSGAAGANRGDVAQLIFNTLSAYFVRYDNDGKLDYVALAGDVKDTMLQRLGAKMYNGGEAFVVDGDEPSAINMKEYLGAYVTAYMNDDEEIIAIEEVKSVYLVGEVDEDKFVVGDVEYTLGDAEYEDEDGATHAAVKFVNGVDKTEDATLEDGEDYTIAAKVSGKKIKEIYSVADWTPSAWAQVDENDLEAIEDDFELLGAAFDENDDEEIDLTSFELLGVDALEDIKEDNIVYVYVGDDTITRVVVGTEVVTGEVTKKNTGDAEFTVGGKVYGFSDLAESDITDITVGDSYDLYLDYAGDVYVVDALEASAEDYAIVLDKDNGEEGLRAEDALLKLLLADGTAKTYAIDEDAIDDGYIEDVADIAEVEVATGVAVKYNVNADGKIDKLEVVTIDGATKDDVTAKGYFNTYKLAANVVILTQADLTADAEKFSDDADDYGVATRESILDQEDVVAHYVLDDGEIVFMVMEGQGTSGDIVYGFVTKIDELKDDQVELTVIVDGKEVKYTAEDTIAVEVGDTLYAFDFDVEGLAEIADSEDNKIAVVEVAEGEITKVNSKVFIGEEKTFAANLDDAVKVYEVVDGKVETASKADLKGLDTADVDFYDVDEDGVADIVVF